MRTRVIVLLLLISITSVAQTFMGRLSGYARPGKSILLAADTSRVRFTFYASDILRVDYLPSPNSVSDSSYSVIQDTLSDISCTILESDSTLVITSPSITVRCRKFPLRLSMYDSRGVLLLDEPLDGGVAARGDERIATFLLNPREHFYGTGERGTSLDKRGQRFENYNTQVGGYSTPLPSMNINIPFLASTHGYALFFDNTYKGIFDLGASDSTRFTYTATGGELSFYVIAAATIPHQLERYTWLTGRQPLPPRWAFGFIQSKNRYQNEAEARSIVDTMRRKNFPCDAIVLDLQWFDKMGDLRWNLQSWPDPAGMMSDFRSRGIKTIVITEPYVVETSVNYGEAARSNFLARDSTGNPYRLEHWWSCGGCSAALVDMTSPSARAWWWSKHPLFMGSLVAGLWTDLGEPERHPAGMIHYLGTSAKVHNIYDLLWAKTLYDGFHALRPDERIFNLTRSGFAGIQRYGVISWSGDVARSFDGLSVQLPMLLNMGMSGLAYQNSDIGGYSRIPTSPELYIRWMQFGTFSPIARAHGAGEVVKGYPTEPWQFGPEAERICRSFIELRYRLLPYIYSMARKNYESGLPLARPLFWEDTNDQEHFNESATYLWGDAFLVSPVVEQGQSTKEVVLPAGMWYNFWTDEIVQGGRSVSVPAPIAQMPLFVKAGSIIPMAPTMSYSDERPLDTLTLAVYPSLNERSSSTLYEDDGKTLAYERGNSAKTTFGQECFRGQTDTSFVMTISPSYGSFDGKLSRRVFFAEIHNVAKMPNAVSLNGVPLREAAGRSPIPTVRDHFFFDGERSLLTIVVTGSTDSSYSIVLRRAHFRR